ncbi:MAG: response regulator [Candidatus Omnitrophota bacterium]|nr:MAG: response regulator [Candidatus Omnitrophota bacterium]
MENIKILIVEDEIDTMETIRNNLKKFLQCEIDISNNGEDAINKIKNNIFDLVILDIKMAGLSGLDVIKNIKQETRLPDILVITAWDSAQVADEVIREGALDYIPKPIMLETLKIKIKNILEKKGRYIEKA